MTPAEARKLMQDDDCTCSASTILDLRGHHGRCPSRLPAAPTYTTAQYTFEAGMPSAGKTVTGTVVKVGKSYADVTWETGRTERVYFTEKAVTFK
jgi:hypothetical protein